MVQEEKHRATQAERKFIESHRAVSAVEKEAILMIVVWIRAGRILDVLFRKSYLSC
jgi:hypothetical protein